MLDELAVAGGCSKEDVDVFQLFDISFQFQTARSDDYVLLPHCRDSAGRYHAEVGKFTLKSNSDEALSDESL